MANISQVIDPDTGEQSPEEGRGTNKKNESGFFLHFFFLSFLCFLIFVDVLFCLLICFFDAFFPQFVCFEELFLGLFHGNLIYFENQKNSSRLTFRYLICYWLLMSSGLPSCGNLFASSY